MARVLRGGDDAATTADAANAPSAADAAAGGAAGEGGGGLNALMASLGQAAGGAIDGKQPNVSAAKTAKGASTKRSTGGRTPTPTP